MLAKGQPGQAALKCGMHTATIFAQHGMPPLVRWAIWPALLTWGVEVGAGVLRAKGVVLGTAVAVITAMLGAATVVVGSAVVGAGVSVVAAAVVVGAAVVVLGAAVVVAGGGGLQVGGGCVQSFLSSLRGGLCTSRQQMGPH